MDTFDHERHCSKCKQRDYLPTKCTHCKEYFCSDHLHYMDHECTFFDMEQNIATEEEINRSKLSKKHHCNVKGCSDKTFLQCKTCGFSYCLGHRFPENHSCSEFIKNKSSNVNITQKASTLFSLAMLRNQRHSNQNTITINNSSSVRELLNIPTSLHKRTGKYVIQKRLISEPLKFVNKKNEPAMPIFKPNLEEVDQSFFDIFFPIDSYIHPVHFVIQKSWKIGRLVDALCSQANITRSIDRNSNHQVHIYRISTGERISNDLRIQDLLENGKLNNHEPLILEYGSSEDNKLGSNIILKLYDSCKQDTGYIRQQIERLQIESMKEILVQG